MQSRNSLKSSISHGALEKFQQNGRKLSSYPFSKKAKTSTVKAATGPSASSAALARPWSAWSTSDSKTILRETTSSIHLSQDSGRTEVRKTRWLFWPRKLKMPSR